MGKNNLKTQIIFSKVYHSIWKKMKKYKPVVKEETEDPSRKETLEEELPKKTQIEDVMVELQEIKSLLSKVLKQSRYTGRVISRHY